MNTAAPQSQYASFFNKFLEDHYSEFGAFPEEAATIQIQV
jgi:hypothetical protein